jgi:hypothetical protein
MKRNTVRSFTFLLTLVMISSFAIAQEKEVLRSADSLKTVTAVVDSTAPEGQKVKKVRVYNPKKAALRSAILPGWGQIYNKKYWKLPIVYGALGTSAGIFFFNLDTYRDTRAAYKAKYNIRQPGATAADTLAFNNIPDYLKPLSEGQLRSYRDSYRRDIDYSVIFFVLLWGFLSFRFKPGYSEMAGTSGLSFVVYVDKKKQKALLPSRF